MGVEDEEPLTLQESGGEGSVGPVGTDTLNTLLATALHKHAVKKLSKKLPKNWKTQTVKQEGTNQSSDKKKKTKKAKLSEKHTEESFELQTVREPRDSSRSRNSTTNDQQSEKEQVEPEHQVAQDVLGGQEGDASPTKAYLKAVSVPKKKHGKKSMIVNDSDKVLGITVHCADRFEGSPLLFPHPVVQVYICNSDTGELLHKSSKDRKATSYYEGEDLHYILPMMTQPYDVKNARSLFCRWEEELIINEATEHFISDDPSVIIFFQLMDFPTPSSETSNTLLGSLLQSADQGWVTFAWAFLKVKGANNHINIGTRLRLQLWRPSKSSKVSLKELYSWWKSGSRKKYGSTLYVTLCEVHIPQNPNPALRSMLATQAEGGGAGFMDVVDQSSISGCSPNPSVLANTKPTVNWGRKCNQSCKIPNSTKHSLSHTDVGCLVVKFSISGLKLACGAHKEIFIYDVLTGQLDHTFKGHLGLIYDLCWSDNDQLLISASADSTVRVWQGTEAGQSQVLAHPSYVYTAQFVPGKSHVIVSGCYDHVIRVWTSSKARSYSILQELTNHLSYVNSLCFNPEGNVMYSGDKQGLILVWNVTVPQADKWKKKSKVITLKSEAKMNEIYGTTINYLSYHPSGFRLLVHCRDSQIKLVNHKHWTITQRLKGLLNGREQIRGCISPCGTWVLSGSEDHGLYVWNSDTGEMVAAFMNLPIDGTISCVEFHPHDHMMAVCSYAADTPVLIMSYSEDASVSASVPLSVQPVASGNLLAAKKSSTSNHFYEQSTSNCNSQSVASQESPSPLKAYISQQHKMSESKTLSSHSGEMEHSIFSDTVTRYESNDQVTRKVLKLFRGDLILKKLDSVLRMASEDPLGIQVFSQSRVKGEAMTLGQLATVLYDYTCSQEGELTVKQGDYVTVVEEVNDDWWLVQTADQQSTGLVPALYLQSLPDPPQSHPSPHTNTTPKVIAVPSRSGEISFLSEGTPSKARARRHRAKANSPSILTSTPKDKHTKRKGGRKKSKKEE